MSTAHSETEPLLFLTSFSLPFIFLFVFFPLWMNPCHACAFPRKVDYDLNRLGSSNKHIHTHTPATSLSLSLPLSRNTSSSLCIKKLLLVASVAERSAREICIWWEWRGWRRCIQVAFKQCTRIDSTENGQNSLRSGGAFSVVEDTVI